MKRRLSYGSIVSTMVVFDTAEGKGKYILVNKPCSCIIKNVQIFSLGQRLAISGLISLKGFHLRSLDIFKCDEVHNMDSDHFAQWIKNISEILRSEHGKNAKLVIIIDNATWHNQLTTESQPPKRSWKKSILQEWLTTRKIKYDTFMTEAELLELAFENLPPRQYVVDNVAAEYGVQRRGVDMLAKSALFENSKKTPTNFI